jgi:hypothetical protein
MDIQANETRKHGLPGATAESGSTLRRSLGGAAGAGAPLAGAGAAAPAGASCADASGWAAASAAPGLAEASAGGAPELASALGRGTLLGIDDMPIAMIFLEMIDVNVGVRLPLARNLYRCAYSTTEFKGKN